MSMISSLPSFALDDNISFKCSVFYIIKLDDQTKIEKNFIGQFVHHVPKTLFWRQNYETMTL